MLPEPVHFAALDDFQRLETVEGFKRRVRPLRDLCRFNDLCQTLLQPGDFPETPSAGIADRLPLSPTGDLPLRKPGQATKNLPAQAPFCADLGNPFACRGTPGSCVARVGNNFSLGDFGRHVPPSH